MRRVVIIGLFLASGAQASVVLPAEVMADTVAPATMWQTAVPSGVSAPQVIVAETADMTGFSVPPASPVDQTAALLPSSVVPDVTSWTLLLLGMAVVGLVARRRQRIVTA